MESSYFFHAVILILCSALPLSQQQEVPLQHFCQYGQGNFTAGSAFSSNLDSLYSTLSSVTPSDGGFYNVSVGQNPNEVHSIVLCRGDVKYTSCLRCINNATAELRRLCPNQREALIWYDSCMFRYSNRVIFGMAEGDPLFWGYNDQQNVSNSRLESFNQKLLDLMNSLRTRAAAGGSIKKYATGSTPFDDQMIYGLAQCTPDLSDAQCNTCLSTNTEIIPTCCERRIGGKVVGPSCNIRYEYQAFPFYDLTADNSPSTSSPAQPPIQPPPPPGSGNSSSRVAVEPIVHLVLLWLMSLLLFA